MAKHFQNKLNSKCPILNSKELFHIWNRLFQSFGECFEIKREIFLILKYNIAFFKTIHFKYGMYYAPQ